MLADLLAAPAVLAGIIAILTWNMRAGLVAGTLLRSSWQGWPTSSCANALAGIYTSKPPFGAYCGFGGPHL
jgi:hypothetical protein